MRIISKKMLNDFSENHPDAKLPLDTWHKTMNVQTFDNLVHLQNSFSDVEYIGDYRYIFNIKGNKYRLISLIFLESKKVYIRAILTHAEYDKHCKNNTLINL